MAVEDSDIEFYLSGGVSHDESQTDPNASLGGFKSSVIVEDAVEENMFDNVTQAERLAGDTEYRCYCIKNGNSVDSLFNAVIWIEEDTDNNEDDISFAVEVPAGGDTDGSVQVIANESTSPVINVGNVSDWSDSISKGTGVGIDQGAHDANLDLGEIVFVWIRRTIAADADPITDNVMIKIEGDT